MPTEDGTTTHGSSRPCLPAAEFPEARVYGKSDKLGIAVEEDPVDPRDFNATIAHALGMDLNKVVYAPSGRPFLVAGHKRDRGTDKIVAEGKAIMPLFG